MDKEFNLFNKPFIIYMRSIGVKNSLKMI